MSVNIGNPSNTARNVVDMHIGDTSNTARKIVRAWIGDANNIPRLFWEAVKIILVFKPNETRKDSGYTDYSYTVQSNGTYLITFWQSTLSMEATLPSKPILASGKVYDSWPWPHLHYWLMNLTTGDVVTLRVHGSNTSDAINRPMCLGTIFKLEGITVASATEYTTRDVQDGTISYTVPNDGKKHLVFGFVQGDYKSDSTNMNTKHGDAYNRNVPNNLGRVLASVYYGDYNNLPTIQFSCSSWGRSQLVDLVIARGGGN